MSIDEQPIALPKLYGAPAYARPPAPVAAASRPFDPDQLPLEVYQTDEERESMALMPARAYMRGGTDRRRQEPDGAGSGRLRARAFSIRAIAGRLLGGD